MRKGVSRTLVFLLSWPLACAGGPFAKPGDPVLRQDLEWLVDRNCLRAPVTTWPILWGSLDLLERPECLEVAEGVHDARRHALSTGGRARFALEGASQPPVLGGFSAAPREQAQASVGLGFQADRAAGLLSATRVDDPTDDRHWRFDGSYLLALQGNWALGVAAVDRWWGPGWHSSLIWSDNARPVPGLWLNRNRSTAPDSQWFSWLGPWSLALFAGQLEQDRAVPEAKFLGARLVFRPLDSLELGLTRAAQWGGEGRPEDLDSFLDMLAGKDNGQTSGFAPGEDPSNQRGGLDFRWGGAFGGTQTVALYGQFIGEDEAGGLPSKFTWLAGGDWQGRNPLGRHLLYLEFTDTTAGSLSGDNRFNTAFEHGTYQTGWRYYGRNLASTWGPDSQVATLGLRQRFRSREGAGLVLSRAHFNRDGKIRGFPGSDGRLEPVTKQEIWLVEADYQRPLLGGRVRLAGSWASEAVPAMPGREQATVSLGWEREWTF